MRQRLFDHKQFTSGEIGFLVREFEQKRKDRETASLQWSLAAVRGMESRVRSFSTRTEEGALDPISEERESLCRSVASLSLLFSLSGFAILTDSFPPSLLQWIS